MKMFLQRAPPGKVQETSTVFGSNGLQNFAGRLPKALAAPELEAAGYVDRVADPRDGRARRAVYTPRGRRLLRDIDAVNAAIAAKLIERLGRERFDRLLGDLADLDAALGSKEGMRIVIGEA